ncbi:Uncharacterised protein [Salmonella enterica]|uniref:Uncharacterized protein n=1 Tax=Salmonella enterica TaxID=28901 RepID=A0A7D8IWV1_SALER|nr:Uncharacterised protein [Salmonella enterica]
MEITTEPLPEQRCSVVPASGLRIWAQTPAIDEDCMLHGVLQEKVYACFHLANEIGHQSPEAPWSTLLVS